MGCCCHTYTSCNSEALHWNSFPRLWFTAFFCDATMLFARYFMKTNWMRGFRAANRWREENLNWGKIVEDVDLWLRRNEFQQSVQWSRKMWKFCVLFLILPVIMRLKDVAMSRNSLKLLGIKINWTKELKKGCLGVIFIKSSFSILIDWHLPKEKLAWKYYDQQIYWLFLLVSFVAIAAILWL